MNKPQPFVPTDGSAPDIQTILDEFERMRTAYVNLSTRLAVEADRMGEMRSALLAKFRSTLKRQRKAASK